jgi:FkbM family methyltransferase
LFQESKIIEIKVIMMMKKLSHRLAYFYAMIFATPKMANFHYFLLKMSLRGIGVMNYYDLVVSGETFVISNVLPRLFQNDSPLFFDVGANRGEYSLMLASKFPRAQIFAFEPHPRNFEVLVHAKIQNFSPHALALSNKTGQFTLYDHDDTDWSFEASLYHDVISEVMHKNSISYPVQVDTLDSFAQSHDIDFIDYLKIDTEGSELAVLQGALDMLEKDKIGVIQLEFNEMNIISRSFFYDFRKILHNYTLFRLLPKGLLPIPENPLLTELFGFQNVLAVHKNKLHLL